MPPFGFCGPTYQSESPNVDAQRCMNFYPEVVESGAGVSRVALYPTPGTLLAVAVTGAHAPQINALANCYGAIYCTAANGAYKINATTLAITALGAVGSTASPGSIACNNANQVIFCTGGAMHLWDGATLTRVANALGVNFAKVRYVDGYFVAAVSASQKFYISGLEDGTTWNALDFGNISTFPENIIDMEVLQRQIWFLGAKQSTAYYNSGDPNFPFQPIQGAFMEHGAFGENFPFSNSYSTAVLDNTMFWIGANATGGLVGWRLSGYTPQRVTNHAIEAAWQSYASVDAATTYTYAYQENGHTFWVVQLSTATGEWKTWVYDVESNQWHERGHYVSGVYYATFGLTHCYAAGTHFVGGWDGNLYKQSVAYLTDNGATISRFRRAPHIGSEKKWYFHQSMQLDMETGTANYGSATGVAAFLLKDTVGTYTWNKAIDNGGASFTTTKDLSGPPEISYIFQDLVDPTAFYTQVITTAGVSSLVRVAQPQNYIVGLTMQSPNGSLYLYQVSNGAALITAQTGTPPLVSLRWSDDSCRTWSNYYALSAGSLGEYRKRVIWRQLGRSRDRVYEVSMSDPAPWRLVDAYLEATPGQ